MLGVPRDRGRTNDGDLLMLKTVIAAAALLLCTVGVGQAWAAEAPVKVDAARMNNADRDAANWLSYGRTYSEQRFSALSSITADNAKQLGLAWFADLDTNRGQQATPLVIDGAMYVSTAWSMVKAYDAATGKLLWSFATGARHNDINQQMREIARALSATERDSLAEWYGKP
jgi:quinohemoprotein ethanol dehydrogenase